MREIAVLSGKGGTGKTSFVAAFAELAKQPIVLGDCDVDASNLALLVHGTDVDEEPFFAGQRAQIDENKCTGCEACLSVCRFNALSFPDGIYPKVDGLACEGCRACAVVCAGDAISFSANRSGTLYVRETDASPLVHASLGIAEDNSGKLVARVREKTRDLAEERGVETVLLDGPPGIGCPVHAALGGVDLVVAITEPTPSGMHDLIRLIDLCALFRLRVVVVVNKFDLNGTSTFDFEKVVNEQGAELIGSVPFDRKVPIALARGESPLVVPIIREALQRIWARIESV